MDVFDAVAALENLSGQNVVIYNAGCSDINENGIDLSDVLYLVERIAVVNP